MPDLQVFTTYPARRFWASSAWRRSPRGSATCFFPRPIEIVNFQTLTFPRSLFIPPSSLPHRGGTPATIFGVLRLPEGTGPVPAVVVTHGCSGITGAETYWAESLPIGRRHVRGQQFRRARHSRVCSGQQRSAWPACSRMFIARGTSPGSPPAHRPSAHRGDGIFFRWSHGSLGKPPPVPATLRFGIVALCRHLAFYPQAATSGWPMKITWRRSDPDFPWCSRRM